jgi:hypothetical protein
MPHWLRVLRAIASAVALAAPLGGIATAASVWWCLQSVEGRQLNLQSVDEAAPTDEDSGPLLQTDPQTVPQTVRLHIRDGVYFLVARDQLPGVDWINIERVAQPSTNASLDAPIVPAWAEMPAAFRDPSATGVLPRVGTLAVGWPSLAIARQWVEPDPTRGFIPAVENDDDGSSTAKAAARFFGQHPTSSVIVLWPGLIANLVVFTLLALPVVLLFRWRHSAGITRRASGA